MAIGSSIVGVWNIFTDWGDTGNAVFVGTCTFNPDSTFSFHSSTSQSTYPGRWAQMEGMCFFYFDEPGTAGLVYTANVTRDTVSGIMGYALPDWNPIGVWWGTRLGAPHLTAEQERAGARVDRDALFGPARE